MFSCSLQPRNSIFTVLLSISRKCFLENILEHKKQTLQIILRCLLRKVLLQANRDLPFVLGLDRLELITSKQYRTDRQAGVPSRVTTLRCEQQQQNPLHRHRQHLAPHSTLPFYEPLSELLFLLTTLALLLHRTN